MRGVSHRFGPILALDDVSLAVPRGAFVVLLGPNGAGKSTLFALVTRLYDNVSGEIRILGHDVRRHPTAALQQLGVVFQSRSLDDDLSLLQNLTYHAALQGIGRRAGHRLAIEALAKVGPRRARRRQGAGAVRRPGAARRDRACAAARSGLPAAGRGDGRPRCRLARERACHRARARQGAGRGRALGHPPRRRGRRRRSRSCCCTRGASASPGSCRTCSRLPRPATCAARSCASPKIRARRPHDRLRRSRGGLDASGYLACFSGIVWREVLRFLHQRERFLAALVRPLVWLFIFAAGFRQVLGVSIIPPYQTYVLYEVFVTPGLVGMILLFNAMQSSLSMVYDRETGAMRTLLVSPFPRSFLLISKLLGGVAVAAAAGLRLSARSPISGRSSRRSIGYLTVLPALVLSGLMLGALALFMSSVIRQLENFAGVMNFVIFPMFFASSALYPLWRIKELSPLLYEICRVNPFTHAVELIRFALYGQIEPVSLAIVLGFTVLVPGGGDLRLQSVEGAAGPARRAGAEDDDMAPSTAGRRPDRGACVALAGPPALAADAANPDWPCVQRKVATLTSAQMWDGPPVDDLTQWRDNEEISKLIRGPRQPSRAAGGGGRGHRGVCRRPAARQARRCAQAAVRGPAQHHQQRPRRRDERHRALPAASEGARGGARTAGRRRSGSSRRERRPTRRRAPSWPRPRTGTIGMRASSRSASSPFRSPARCRS